MEILLPSVGWWVLLLPLPPQSPPLQARHTPAIYITEHSSPCILDTQYTMSDCYCYLICRLQVHVHMKSTHTYRYASRFLLFHATCTHSHAHTLMPWTANSLASTWCSLGLSLSNREIEALCTIVIECITKTFVM